MNVPQNQQSFLILIGLDCGAFRLVTVQQTVHKTVILIVYFYVPTEMKHYLCVIFYKDTVAVKFQQWSFFIGKKQSFVTQHKLPH